MPTDIPPTIDPVAAARWQRAAPAHSPWLHEEVARRMESRLQWMRQPPAVWCHWAPVRGGLQAHGLIAQRYPQADCVVAETPAHEAQARAALDAPWWRKALRRQAVQFAAPADASVQMLWANMALHLAPDPQALLQQWQRAVAVDGFLMFSCLGPDTVRELHSLYRELGWPAPAHALSDMHDWGDRLIDAGFAEPVVDMERITLTFATPVRALQELRELGRNFHPQRFASLRGRGWRTRLEQAMAERLSDAQGQIALSFEIIYGHAFKPAPRVRLQANTSVALEDMRTMLRSKSAKGP